MIEVEIEADAWADALPEAASICRRAAEAALLGARPHQENLDVEGLETLGEVSILLTDDQELRDLNARFRGQDKPTNVLSFPSPEHFAPHLGDVALAYETCAREAAEQGKPLAHHLSHLVAHGVLHLLGWDHQTDAEADEMEALERTVLAALGIPDPYAARNGTDAELRRPE